MPRNNVTLQEDEPAGAGCVGLSSAIVLLSLGIWKLIELIIMAVEHWQ